MTGYSAINSTWLISRAGEFPFGFHQLRVPSAAIARQIDDHFRVSETHFGNAFEHDSGDPPTFDLLKLGINKVTTQADNLLPHILLLMRRHQRRAEERDYARSPSLYPNTAPSQIVVKVEVGVSDYLIRFIAARE